MLALGPWTPSAMGGTVADEDPAALASGGSTALPAEPDPAPSSAPTPPAAPEPAPAPLAAPDPAQVPPAPADPTGPHTSDRPTAATTAPADDAPAGRGDATTAPATKKQNQPAKSTPAAAPPATPKKQTAAATTSGATTASGATAKDNSPAGATTAPDKDPNASGSRAPSPASGDRPPTDAQLAGAPPPPDPAQPDGAAPRTASPPVETPGVPTPPTVSTPAIVAHQVEPRALPRSDPSFLEPALADQDHASGRVAVTLAELRPAPLAELRPAPTGLLASQTPTLAPPILPAPAASPAEADARAHARVHRGKPAQASPRANHQAPVSPFAPPQRGPVSVAGTAASSGGGASAAMWSAVLFGFFLYAARDLRRHRGHLLLAGPAGVPSPQQRPG